MRRLIDEQRATEADEVTVDGFRFRNRKPKLTWRDPICAPERVVAGIGFRSCHRSYGRRAPRNDDESVDYNVMGDGKLHSRARQRALGCNQLEQLDLHSSPRRHGCWRLTGSCDPQGNAHNDHPDKLVHDADSTRR